MMTPLFGQATCSRTSIRGARVSTRRPHALSLIRDRVVCIPGLKNVNWHFVQVSDFLPADEEMGQEGSGISHLTALIGVKGDERCGHCR
jgi:hypothetical protein